MVANSHAEKSPGTQESENQRQYSRFRSLKWQIVSIALVSVIGLISFVAQVMNDAQNEAALLQEIKEQSYPTQAQLLAALHSLEFIHRELENAVTTGDEDAAKGTNELAKKFRQHLAVVSTLTNDPAVAVVMDEFELYHRDSKSLALELMNPYAAVESLLSRGKENSEKYDWLMTQLKILYQDSNTQFANGIASATDRASESVRFAISSGLLIVGLVLTIALFTANSIIRRIRDMVDKLKGIALEDGDLKVRISLTGSDEMTELAYWFNGIINKLEDTSRQAENNILKIANTDELSGLYNRRYLVGWLQKRIEADQGDDKFTVLFLDLDDFKPINDTFGHEAGDELIAMVAQRLQSVISSQYHNSKDRPECEESPVVARLGGDEFMVIIPGIIDYRSIENMVIQMRTMITAPYSIEDTLCEIGVSVGISRYPSDATDRDSLLDRADLAMYEAKRKGKKQFAFYDKQIEKEHSFRTQLEQLLRRPQLHNELSLVYQPKFSLQDGTFLGAEALLRWNSPEMGQIAPDVFIPFAEEKQFIAEIDLWVLNEACRQISAWTSEGYEIGRIAINLSARTLRLPALPLMVADVLQSHQINPSSLQLEITESAVLDLSNALTESLVGLRELGVTIAMDDFGAGHSSLMLLMNNQIDLVKLDKSLIDNISNNSRRQKIVQSIVLLADNLGVATLAEGIETRDQWDYLSSINCQEGQGYYYSRPLSVQALIDQFLKSQPGAADITLKRVS